MAHRSRQREKKIHVAYAGIESRFGIVVRGERLACEGDAVGGTDFAVQMEKFICDRGE